jgi:YesN/AraC family two-component response regulator
MGNSEEIINNIIESFDKVINNAFIITDVIKLDKTLHYSANRAVALLERKILKENFELQLDESLGDNSTKDNNSVRQTIADYSILFTSSKKENLTENFDKFIKFLFVESLNDNMEIEENINLFMAFFLKDISEILSLSKDDYECYQKIKEEKFLKIKIEKLLGFVEEIITKKEQSNNYSRNVRFALSYIDKNLDQPVSLSTVANLCAVSPAYLSSIVKKETGVNFVDLVNKKKIQKAINLMKSTSLNMEEISRSCGFSDYAYFFQVFKKYIGVSPKSYTNNIATK